MDRRNDRARLGHDRPALTGGLFLFVLALDDVNCRSDTRVVPVIGCDHVDAPEFSPSLMHEFDMGALLERRSGRKWLNTDLAEIRGALL
jgi:hypothetical protein